MQMDQLLREQAVLAVYGKRKTALWDDVKEELFPKPVRIGAQAVAWPASEVSAVIAARIGGLSNDDIRSLVSKLRAKRRALAAELLATAASVAALSVAALLAPLDAGVSLAGMVVFGGRPRQPARHDRMGEYGLLVSGVLRQLDVSQNLVVRAIGVADGRGSSQMVTDGAFGRAVWASGAMTGEVGGGLIAQVVDDAIRWFLGDPAIAAHPAVVAVLAELEAERYSAAELEDPLLDLRPDREGYIDEPQLLASPDVRAMADAADMDVRTLIRGEAEFPSPRERSRGRTGWPAPAVLHAIRQFRARHGA